MAAVSTSPTAATVGLCVWLLLPWAAGADPGVPGEITVTDMRDVREFDLWRDEVDDCIVVSYSSDESVAPAYCYATSPRKPRSQWSEAVQQLRIEREQALLSRTIRVVDMRLMRRGQIDEAEAEPIEP